MNTIELIKGINYWANLLKNSFDLMGHLRNSSKETLWYDYRQKDDEFVDEIIKRLKELDKLKAGK